MTACGSSVTKPRLCCNPRPLRLDRRSPDPRRSGVGVGGSGMGLTDRLGREWRFLSGLVRTLARVSGIAAVSPNLTCDDLEAAVDRWRNRPAISFEGRVVTYGELDGVANRYAHWAQDQGIHRGDVVALFMPNRLEYLAIWFGLAKVG